MLIKIERRNLLVFLGDFYVLFIRAWNLEAKELLTTYDWSGQTAYWAPDQYFNGNSTQYFNNVGGYKVKATRHCWCIRSVFSEYSSSQNFADSEPVEFNSGDWIINCTSSAGKHTIVAIIALDKP